MIFRYASNETHLSRHRDFIAIPGKSFTYNHILKCSQNTAEILCCCSLLNQISGYYTLIRQDLLKFTRIEARPDGDFMYGVGHTLRAQGIPRAFSDAPTLDIHITYIASKTDSVLLCKLWISMPGRLLARSITG